MNSNSDSEKEFSVMLRSLGGKRTVDSGSDYEGNIYVHIIKLILILYDVDVDTHPSKVSTVSSS